MEKTVGQEMLKELSYKDHIGKGGRAVFFCHLGCGDGERLDVTPNHFASDEGRIVEYHTALGNCAFIFVKGRKVHRDENIGI